MIHTISQRMQSTNLRFELAHMNEPDQRGNYNKVNVTVHWKQDEG